MPPAVDTLTGTQSGPYDDAQIYSATGPSMGIELPPCPVPYLPSYLCCQKLGLDFDSLSRFQATLGGLLVGVYELR